MASKKSLSFPREPSILRYMLRQQNTQEEYYLLEVGLDVVVDQASDPIKVLGRYSVGAQYLLDVGLDVMQDQAADAIKVYNS